MVSVMPVTSANLSGREPVPPSRQVVLRDGAARVVLALLDVPGVDRLWMLTGRGVPVRVDAGLEWEHRTTTVDPATHSARLPAGGIDVVMHDNRHDGLESLDAALTGEPGVTAVIFIRERSVDVVDPATARRWAAGDHGRDPESTCAV
jgi:hypothetical protein